LWIERIRYLRLAKYVVVGEAGAVAVTRYVTILKGLAVLFFIGILAIVALNVYPLLRPAAKTVRAVATISFPAPVKITRPFIDYLTVGGSRLYAGYTSHGMVGLIDIGTNRVVATIGSLGRVHGIALVRERNLGFASSSGDNNVNVFDLVDHKLLKKIPAGDGPDAIIYDPKAHLVYVSDHAGKTGRLIDPATQTVVAVIALGGEPEYSQVDPETGWIYQNLEDTSELVVLDPQKRALIQRYQLAPGEGPTGLAFDVANRRLFSTCSGKLIVLNADTGAIIAVLPIGALTDGVDYDAALHRVYTANGVGSMTVIQQDSADRYRVLENAPTRFGGHSLVVDPATHRIFVAYFGSIAVYEPVSQP
jgi:DNA-binding beta-propeller fold protein YncE